MAQTLRTCSALPPLKGFELTGVNGKFWDKTELTVRFLDGEQQVKEKVQRWAEVWTDTCGVRFNFGDHKFADIRVSFKGKGSWSSIGIDALTKAQSEPTMNFGWLTSTTADDEYSRVVLHEFGHALGFAHEHQHPEANIQWNRSVVENYHAEHDGWTRDEVQKNVFEQYLKTKTNYSQYDKQSIMNYPILAGWTTNGFVVGWNKDLSETDKTFSAKLYKDLLNKHLRYLDGATDGKTVTLVNGTTHGTLWKIEDAGNGLVRVRSWNQSYRVENAARYLDGASDGKTVTLVNGTTHGTLWKSEVVVGSLVRLRSWNQSYRVEDNARYLDGASDGRTVTMVKGTTHGTVWKMEEEGEATRIKSYNASFATK